MDPSKFPQGSDECSNNESGWTTYIGSPHHEEDRDDDDDDRDRSKDGEEHKEKDADSDDSMASDASSAPSDASSAPSDQFGHFNKQLGYGYAKSTSERKHGGKKEQKQGDTKQHAEKIKAAKDKADCATRSRKK